MLNDYYYKRLDYQQRRIYEQFIANINDNKERFALKDIPAEKTVEYILAEHPEFYFCNLREIDYKIDDTGIHAEIVYVYNEIMRKNIESSANQLAASFKKTPDVELTVRLVHNYFVKNIAYDYASGMSNKYDHITHTIIGPFTQGRGVCEGISLSFKYILGKIGIESAVAVGTLKNTNEILHMWNIVEINGNRYHIDVTQDISATESRWGKPSYMFYMLTDAEMMESHEWEGAFNCSADIDNPFRKNVRTFHSETELISYLRLLPAGQRLINFKYTGSESKDEITAIVARNIPKDEAFRHMSVVQHAGIYYFFKEV